MCAHAHTHTHTHARTQPDPAEGREARQDYRLCCPNVCFPLFEICLKTLCSDTGVDAAPPYPHPPPPLPLYPFQPSSDASPTTTNRRPTSHSNTFHVCLSRSMQSSRRHTANYLATLFVLCSVCVCVRACVRVCVRVCACVRACVRVFVYV